MLLVRLTGVTHHFGSRTVLDGLNAQIDSGQKIGVIGGNGSGKTTLLNIIVGDSAPSDGECWRAPTARIGYVPQYVRSAPAETVQHYLSRDITEIEKPLREAEELMARSHDAKSLEPIMRRYEEARDAWDAAEGDRFASRAVELLERFGLGGLEGNTVSSLSGGEQNLLSLARALIRPPDLLILDEPGNHLDYAGLERLENLLQELPVSVLVVSHNRYLLDRVVRTIWELDSGAIKVHAGGYSDFRRNTLTRLVAQQEDYAANRKRLNRLEDLVRKFAEISRRIADPAWGKRLRARRSQLDRERRQAVERPDIDNRTMSLELSGGATKSTIALDVSGYSKSFGDTVILQDAELHIACGERVALVGPNGSGKSTLLRDIVRLGSWDNPGLRVGPSMIIGYCPQHQEVLDPELSVEETLTDLSPVGRDGAFAIISRFLFSYADLDKRVGVLSGGEKNRLQLARLELLKPTFLILDEPTNHLDILAREAIEESLEGFDGTILVVSHDRYFLDRIAARTVEIRDAGLVGYSGGFSEYWAARKVLDCSDDRVPGLADLESEIAALEREKMDLERQATEAFSRRASGEAKKLNARIGRVQKRIDELYTRIE